jgi:hypothetical protein
MLRAAVPEATIDKYRQPRFWDGNVGTAGQSTVHAISESTRP